MGNPWEIVRNDVSHPVKFYGNVVSGSDGKRHWIGGEDIQAVAYDVPIPGYKTKTTINLRLWSTKAPSQDFDLYSFNSGEHTKACEALANAEKVCMSYVVHFVFFFFVFRIFIRKFISTSKVSVQLANPEFKFYLFQRGWGMGEGTYCVLPAIGHV
jgi:hypothetical protein